MQLSETHLKHIIKKELRSLLEQEQEKKYPWTDIEAKEEAKIRYNYIIRNPVGNPPNPKDRWHNKKTLKDLWRKLAQLGVADNPERPRNVSWDYVGRMIDPDWDPQDPPHWIPPVSQAVCSEIKKLLGSTFDEIGDCYPQKPINVNVQSDHTLKLKMTPFRPNRPPLSEYEICVKQREAKKAQLKASGLEPDYIDMELAMELALFLTSLKLAAAGVLTGLMANPYTLIALFGASVVMMAFDIMESDCEDLLEKSYHEEKGVNPKASGASRSIMPPM
jgi:hypothetical protein